MKMFFFIITSCLLLLITSSFSSCETGHLDDRLTTINNSQHSIFSIIQFNFPDTALLGNGGCIGCFVEIAPNASEYHLNGVNWERDIKRRNKLNTLTVFIVHSDTLRKYPFEQLQADYNILRRYDLTVDQLKSMDWKVRYP